MVPRSGAVRSHTITSRWQLTLHLQKVQLQDKLSNRFFFLIQLGYIYVVCAFCVWSGDAVLRTESPRSSISSSSCGKNEHKLGSIMLNYVQIVVQKRSWCRFQKSAYLLLWFPTTRTLTCWQARFNLSSFHLFPVSAVGRRIYLPCPSILSSQTFQEGVATLSLLLTNPCPFSLYVPAAPVVPFLTSCSHDASMSIWPSE